MLLIIILLKLLITMENAYPFRSGWNFSNPGFGVKYSIKTQPRMGRNLLTMGAAHRGEHSNFDDSPERA
jgi:hypothetical protein